jgi:hypothetical protein
MTPNEMCLDVIGMSENMASISARSHGFQFRTTKIDGRYMIVTRDYVPTRINVEILNEKVVNARVG